MPVVADIRGYGMIGGDRRRTPTARPGKRGHAFQKKLFDNGLTSRRPATAAIVAPPLIAETRAHRQIVDILRRTLKAL